MKKKVSKLRLSPNEEARVIREEIDRRRKLRIQQVREQQRQISLQIRREVERRRQQGLRELEEQLREDWERRQREKLHTLQTLYLESLQLIGQSHRSAKEAEAEIADAAQREEEHHAKAEERYREALKDLKIQKTKEQERQKRSINARKKALQTEKERSAKVARLPPPLPDPIQQDIDPRKSHMVKRSDLNAFAATRYHMPESAVAKEPEALQSDARLDADLESRRLQELQKEEDRRRQEQLEKARVRGRQALRREQLEQDRERLLVELQRLQQSDLLRRRQQVSRMPPQIFQPLYQRQEAREELQRDLEFAFEDMYTGERRVKGDLVIQLVPEPLPASSSTGQDLDLDPDQDLDVTVDENAEAENIPNDFGDEGREQEAADGTTPPRQALRKLLDRIRSQRTEWINGSSQVPAADSPSVDTERDMSIETGSLTPEALSEPGLPAPTVEPAEPPPAPEPPLPADFLSRIQEAEEERKKREAELEVEKQQQVALLQELEEQKAELEQMLLEAQRERERLRGAAQQEALLLQPQPVQDRSSEEEAVAPAEEDVSTRRLRQYQQRLLEQNRIHQRSVEVARQRLEEYQRALRIRHNLTATAALRRPPVHPAFLASPSESHPATPSVPPDASLSVFSSSAGSSVPSDPSISNRFSSLGPDAAPLSGSQSMLRRVAKRLPDRPTASPPGTSATSDPMTLTSREADRRTRELQEAQRRVMQQRAVLALQKEQQEEERRRAEEELQHMRRQKEALQALIDTDRPSGSDSPSEASDSQEAERKRLQLLATLLRAIEESNGGSLSHLEEPEDGDDLRGTAPPVPSVAPPEPSGLVHPPQTQKPPVTRVKLGFNWTIPQPHELSAIIEVETPVSMSRVTGYGPDSAERRLTFSGPEDAAPPDLRCGSAKRRVVFSDPEDDVRSRSADVNVQGGSVHDTRRPPGVSSGRADSAGTQVVFPGPDDGVPSRISDVNLQDVSLSTPDRTAQSPSVSSFRPSPAGRQVVSSGPVDGVPSLPADVKLQDGSVERRVGSETSCRLPWRERLLSGAATAPESSDSNSPIKATSPPGSDSGRGADSPGPAALSSRSPSEALCRLTASDCLSTTTVSSGSYVSTDPEQNVSDDRRLFGPTEPGSGAVSCAGFRDSSVPSGPPVDSVFNDSVIQRIIDKYTRELDVSLSAAGTTTDSGALEESGSLPSQPSRTEDETSARRLDVRRHPAAGQDPNPEQTTPGHLALERFSPVNPEQNPSRLAPERLSVLERLVGQPSAHSSMIGARPGLVDRSSWDSTLSRMISRLSQQSDYPGPGFCAGHDTSEPSWSDELPEEVRMRVLVGEQQVSADQHSSGERSSASESREPSGPQSPPASNPQPQNRADIEELDPHGADDSFHPLHPEITHNETADPSVNFHLPPLNTSDDLSLEQLRAEEPDGRGDVQESFSRLVISESVQQDSVLTPPRLSPAPGTPPPGFGAASALGSSEAESSRVSVPVGEQQEDFSSSEITPESDGEKGILEQSQITLVSLTDTTLQDAVATDDEGLQDSDGPDSLTDGQETMETEPTEGAESTHQTPSASLLELRWSPDRNLQDVFLRRRRALMQRSDRRVQEIKAKRAAARNGPPSRVLEEGRDPGRAAVQTVPRKETAAEDRKLRPPPTGRRSGPQIGADVRISDPDQRKRNLSEMHQRTQRLYEQLEEVKQQRAARSRQEDWARNRLRAKEFHRKTLQKLRAKQTPTF